MSLPAVEFVRDHADCSGTDLAILLIIASYSKWKKIPFTADVSTNVIYAKCKLSKQGTLDAIDRLLKSKQLGIWREAKGSRPTRWDLLPLVVNSTLPQAVYPTRPVMQGDDREKSPILKEDSILPFPVPIPSEAKITYGKTKKRSRKA